MGQTRRASSAGQNTAMLGKHTQEQHHQEKDRNCAPRNQVTLVDSLKAAPKILLGRTQLCGIQVVTVGWGGSSVGRAPTLQV